MANILLKINDVDKTENVILGSLNIDDLLTAKINTCSFSIWDTDGSNKPTPGDIVKVYDTASTLIFAGLVASASEKRNSINPENSSEILQYSIQCQDWTKLLTRKLVIETFVDKTCYEIISYIINKYYSNEGITLANVDTGPTVSQITFNYKQGDKAIEELARATGYDWYIDYDKDIHFFLPGDGTPVLTITDDTTNWTNLQLNPDTSQIRNRVYVRGGIYYSDPYTQMVKPDGVQEELAFAYTPQLENLTVTINGVSKTIGLKNIDEKADYDFLLDRKEKTLSMGETAWALANTPLLTTDSVIFVYNYEIPVLIVQEDSDSIAALQSLEGGSGVYEYLIIDKNITSIDAARTRASAELRDYANAIVNGSVISYDSVGIKSGDLITINSTRRGINANYAIKGVKIKQLTRDQLQYTLDFSGTLYGFVDILMSLFKRSSDVLLGLDEVLDAFNLFRDEVAVAHNVPTLTLGAPPYVWSNDEGTTPNKMRWSLFEWT